MKIRGRPVMFAGGTSPSQARPLCRTCGHAESEHGDYGCTHLGVVGIYAGEDVEMDCTCQGFVREEATP